MYNENDFLFHYGIKGQKWGIRRFQNEDGTLTSEGKDHYGTNNKSTNFLESRRNKKHDKFIKQVDSYGLKNRISKKNLDVLEAYPDSSQKHIMKYMQKNPKVSFNQADRHDTSMSILKAIAAAGTILAVSGYVMKKSKNSVKSVMSSDYSVSNIMHNSRNNSVCIKGNEYIKMMHGRSQWGKGL